MIMLDLGEVGRWIFCIIVPLVMAIIGGRLDVERSLGKSFIFFVIFLSYWALATVGLYHLSLSLF